MGVGVGWGGGEREEYRGHVKDGGAPHEREGGSGEGVKNRLNSKVFPIHSG